MSKDNECTRRRIRVPTSCLKKERGGIHHFNLEVIFDWNNCGYGYVLRTTSTGISSRRVALGLLKTSEMMCSIIARDEVLKTSHSLDDSQMSQYVSNLKKKSTLNVRRCRFYDSNTQVNCDKNIKFDFKSHTPSESSLGAGYVSLREGPLSRPERVLPSSEEETLLRILVGIKWRGFMPWMHTPLIATISESLNFVKVPVSTDSENKDGDGPRQTMVLLLISEDAYMGLPHGSTELEEFSEDLLLLPLFARGQRIMGIIGASNEDIFTGCVSPSTFLMCMWKLKKMPSSQVLVSQSISDCEIKRETEGIDEAKDMTRMTFISEHGGQKLNLLNLKPASLAKSRRCVVTSKQSQAHNFMNFEIFWGLKLPRNPMSSSTPPSRPLPTTLHRCYPFFVKGAAINANLLAKFKKCAIAEIFCFDFVMEPLKNLYQRMQRKQRKQRKGRQARLYSSETVARKRSLENEFENLFFKRKRKRLNANPAKDGELEQLRYIEVYVTPEIYQSGFGRIDYNSCSLLNSETLDPIDCSSTAEAAKDANVFAVRFNQKKMMMNNGQLYKSEKNKASSKDRKTHPLNSVDKRRRRPKQILPAIQDELGTLQAEWKYSLNVLRKKYRKESDSCVKSLGNSKHKTSDVEPPRQTIKFVEHAAKSFSRVITEERNKDSGKLPIALSLVFEKVLTIDHVKRSKEAKLNQDRSVKKANDSSHLLSKLNGKDELESTSLNSISRRASVLAPPLHSLANAQTVALNLGPRRNSNTNLRKPSSFASSRSIHARGMFKKLGTHLNLRPLMPIQEYSKPEPPLSAPGYTFNPTEDSSITSSGSRRAFFSAPPSPLHTSFVTSSPAYLSALNPLFSIRDVENPDLGLNLDTSKPIDVYSLYYNHLSCPLPDGQLENLNWLQDKKLRETCPQVEFNFGASHSGGSGNDNTSLKMLRLTRMDRSVSHESGLPYATQRYSSYENSSIDSTPSNLSLAGSRNEPNMLGTALNLNINFGQTDEKSFSAEINYSDQTPFSLSPNIIQNDTSTTEESDKRDSTDYRVKSQILSEGVTKNVEKKDERRTPLGSCVNCPSADVNFNRRPSKFYRAHNFDGVNASTVSFDGIGSDCTLLSEPNLGPQSEQGNHGSDHHQANSDEYAYIIQRDSALGRASNGITTVPRAFEKDSDSSISLRPRVLTHIVPSLNPPSVVSALSCPSSAANSEYTNKTSSYITQIPSRTIPTSYPIECDHYENDYINTEMDLKFYRSKIEKARSVDSSSQKQSISYLQHSCVDYSHIDQPVHTHNKSIKISSESRVGIDSTGRKVLFDNSAESKADLQESIYEGAYDHHHKVDGICKRQGSVNNKSSQ